MLTLFEPDDSDCQGQMSVLVQKLANGDVVGHVLHQTIKSNFPPSTPPGPV
jgi:hypothetical protein